MYCVMRASAPSLYNVYRRYDVGMARMLNTFQNSQAIYQVISLLWSWKNSDGDGDTHDHSLQLH